MNRLRLSINARMAESDDNRDRLITNNTHVHKAGIPKIANATADYYRVLVGLPDAVKVDRLVKRFLAHAGIEVKKYSRFKKYCYFCSETIKEETNRP